MIHFLKMVPIIGIGLILLLFSGTALATSGEGGGEIAFDADCGCIEKGVSIGRMTPLTQFYADTFLGDFEAKGVSIRNTWSGNITLSEIPGGATIHAVYLYWMVLNPLPACSTGTFDGNALDGALVGRDEDPCWGLSESCYVWRQEVTSWVGGNGTYAVEIDSVVDGTGNDKGEGASLVVLYEDAAEAEKVFLIYDGCVTLKGSLEEYSWSLTGFTADLPCSEAKTAFIIGDGQGVGQGDSMFYNSTCIDWNTTEGNDGPYWDTRTYDVTILTPGGSNQSDYRYHPATSKDDCVTLGVCVIGVSRDLIGIELSSFNAYQFVDCIILEWQLESEAGIVQYVIKRSEYCSPYEEIARIPGQGNSSKPHGYTYEDNHAEPGVPYRYMLGVIDLNAQTSWFGPVSAQLSPIEHALQFFSSNPIRGKLLISYTLQERARLTIQVRNVAGRMVAMLAAGYFPKGEHQFIWNDASVPDGVYFVVVQRDNTSEIRKALLIR